MTASHSDVPPDPLDDCLKNARWPDPSPDAQTRLSERWHSLAEDRIKSRQRVMQLALAASLLLALGWGSWQAFNPHRPQEIVSPDTDRTSPQMASLPQPTFRVEEFPKPFGRDPNVFESVVFQVAVQRQGGTLQVTSSRKPSPTIKDLSDRAHQFSEWAVVELQSQRAAWESRILTDLPRESRSRQQRDLRLLAVIGSPAAIPVLDKLSRDPEFGKLAWPVALQLAPATLLQHWANAGTIPQRADAIRTLLSRADPESLRLFLRLVAQPKSRPLALQVAVAQPQPPVDSLFQILQHGRTADRHAAGIVLGRIANPEIAHRLLILAQDRGFPSEIMIGLVNTPDPQAARFLSQAKSNPRLLTSMQLACLEWEKITYQSTLPSSLEINQ